MRVVDLYPVIRPFLFALSPEVAHAITLRVLRTALRFGVLPKFIAKRSFAPVTLLGLSFRNRLGIAAGLDKNATCIDAFGALGFGFVEVGTITPLPQSGNELPRLFRLVADRALINRMGFPNDGVQKIIARLRWRRSDVVCGVNIGKNAITPLSDAANDYLACLEAIYPFADYIAINISSPNTEELRRLQTGELLRSLLWALVRSRSALARAHGRHVPLLIKLTADLSDGELQEAARTSVECGVDGIIVSNTTSQRGDLKSPKRAEAGGLSGAPLLSRALHAVATLRAAVGPRFPIVGVGGIDSVESAIAMRAAGADLIQIYTGLVYRGPRLIEEILAAVNV